MLAIRLNYQKWTYLFANKLFSCTEQPKRRILSDICWRKTGLSLLSCFSTSTWRFNARFWSGFPLQNEGIPDITPKREDFHAYIHFIETETIISRTKSTYINGNKSKPTQSFFFSHHIRFATYSMSDVIILAQEGRMYVLPVKRHHAMHAARIYGLITINSNQELVIILIKMSGPRVLFTRMLSLSSKLTSSICIKHFREELRCLKTMLTTPILSSYDVDSNIII